MNERLTFLDCIHECIHTPELVAQFNRLNDAHLGVDKRAPIERMVDEATGYQTQLDAVAEEDMAKFINFVYEFVWMPLMEKE